MEQRFTFHAIASQYEAARPSYPDAMFDGLVARAELRPPDAILEVGAGTGKATEGFARRGFAVTALEPGAEMIAVARRALAGFPDVHFVRSTLEAWTPQKDAFRLVASAQAWHWVDRKIGFPLVAEALKMDGMIAIIGNVPVGVPGPLMTALKSIYARHVPEFSNFTPETAYLPSGPFATTIEASGLFGPVVHQAYPWRWQHTAESYTAFLATRSDHQLMDPAVRNAVLSEVGDFITKELGAFAMEWEAHVYSARKSS